MILKRKKSAPIFKLCIGLVYTILLFLLIFEDSTSFFFYSMFMFLAGYNIIEAIYMYKTPLLEINEESIIYYGFPTKGKQIVFDQLTVRYTVGDFIFKAENGKEYRIVKNQIPEDQLEEFEVKFQEIISHIEAKSAILV